PRHRRPSCPPRRPASAPRSRAAPHGSLERTPQHPGECAELNAPSRRASARPRARLQYSGSATSAPPLAIRTECPADPASSVLLGLDAVGGLSAPGHPVPSPDEVLDFQVAKGGRD